jgi:DNA-binding response OmpR family regulator
MLNPQYTHNALYTSKTILIVEDDEVLGNLVLEALQDETSHQVFLATSAEMAIYLLQTITPALLLVDYHLPAMNGLELIDYLQSTATGEQIPIIFVSAAFPPAIRPRKQIRRLQKPFNLETLLQWVEELVS